jgi:hypothetical protein
MYREMLFVSPPQVLVHVLRILLREDEELRHYPIDAGLRSLSRCNAQTS